MVNAFVRTGVIGYPVKHSLSPLIHNFWINAYKLNGKYDQLEIAPDRLEESIKNLVSGGYRGFNVTIPHKQAVMPLCTDLSETAQKIGAVNTVIVKEDGTVSGDNTDACGFVESIREALPDFDFSRSPALVLGAGGAARAVVYALLQQNVPHVRVVNRTKKNADLIAADFSVESVDWNERDAVVKDAALLINTTSLGMEGQPPLVIDLSGLSPDAAVCDIVYRPRRTPLLKEAAKRGNPVVEGIGMLLHQARPAFRAWYGILPDITEDLRQTLYRNPGA